MKKVFLLVNKLDEFAFHDLLKKYLGDVSVAVGESLPSHPNEYDLIILWSYRKLLPGMRDNKNIMLFHSSDLPAGRGWAPIYHALAKGQEHYVISGILAAEGADTGDVIVKAKFKIQDNYTAALIRQWDYEISIMLVKEILHRFAGRRLKGMPQTGEGSYYPRRRPADNEISADAKLAEIFHHLRACEKGFPAFFYYNQTKFFISIEPESQPEFPRDVEVTFFDSSQ